jgi:hypothetical protein
VDSDDLTPGPARAKVGRGDLTSVDLDELRELAASSPTSGRAAVAKLGALRALERLSRAPGRRGLPEMPPNWHPQAGTEWEELDRVYLDDHPWVRARLWEAFWTG